MRADRRAMLETVFRGLTARVRRPRVWLACVLAVGAMGASAAASAGITCQQSAVDGDAASKMTVCVRRQPFANDIYSLRLDGQPVLLATEKEVSRGVFTQAAGRQVAMRCIADEAPARVSPAVAQALSLQTGVRVQRIANALGSVEVGRRCAVKIDGQDAGQLTFAFN